MARNCTIYRAWDDDSTDSNFGGGTMSDVGVRNSQPTRSFSMAHTTASSPRVRLRIDTSDAVIITSLTYGGVPMTRIGQGDVDGVEHHYEIRNPPIGTHVITGNFSTDVFYIVRMFDDDWIANPT